MMSEEYEYSCPDDLDAQTNDFVEVVIKRIGPYGITRDDSIEFVQACLLPIIKAEDQLLILDVEEYLEVFVGV
jgi:hypothetical protein